MKRILWTISPALLAGMLVRLSLAAAPTTAPSAAGVEYFEKNIRPVLVERCYRCHSKDAEKIKGGLVLDTREGLLKGGDNGRVLIAGDPEKSTLIKAIRYHDEEIRMPPKEPLAPEQV